MRSDALARRYAKGLILAVADPAQLDRIGEELALIRQTFQDEPDLLQALTSPQYQPAAVAAALLERADAAALSPVLARFLAVLVQRRRLPLISRITELYQQLADEAQGRITAEVQTAGPLTPDQQQALTRNLTGVFGRRVRLNIVVEPELLGGMVTRAGSVVLDGSLRNQLQRLQSFIRERPSE